MVYMVYIYDNVLSKVGSASQQHSNKTMAPIADTICGPSCISSLFVAQTFYLLTTQILDVLFSFMRVNTFNKFEDRVDIRSVRSL